MKTTPATLPALLLALIPFLAQPNVARADEDVSVNLVPLAIKGQGKPSLEVTIRKPLTALSVDLRRSDGKNISLTSSKVAAGTTRSFQLDQPEGMFHYEGKLVARFPKGPPQEMPLSFDATLLGPLQITVNDHAVDLNSHTVTFAVDRPLASVHMLVLSDEGKVISESVEKLADTRAHQPITLKWAQNDDANVMKIALRVTDTHSIYREMELYPWKFEIPHEDVLFETGKAEIVEAEKPKLDTAYKELASAVEKYGRFAQVQLFVAGHTDSVGDAASNRTLSESRALSIARYFRSRGVRIPIYFAGFGEDDLLVPTADNTPEAKNRRAAYIVSVQSPPGRWGRLP